MMIVEMLLLGGALICFLLSTFGVTSQINLQSLGLACLTTFVMILHWG